MTRTDTALSLLCANLWATAWATAPAALAATLLAAVGTAQLPAGFGDHWFQGQAELNTYRLEQSRYGELRTGKAIVVFVTEDFDPEALVKDEDGRGPSVGILKMNQIRRFTTGIYDYSMMMSVFTRRQPGAGPRTLKTTYSVQDWCGHAWLQLDTQPAGDPGVGYQLTGHSYFEGENQQQAELPGVLLEDELMVRLRLGPDAMPTGELRAIPAGFDSRLSHYTPKALPAEGRLAATVDGERTYRLAFANGRSVAIRFAAAFPHRILGWEERQGDRLLVRASLEHTVMQPYWRLNGTGSEPMREDLGLPRRDL